jgi:hypothetical protein
MGPPQPKAMTDPRELRLIQVLLDAGFRPIEIRKYLRMSKTTLYRKLGEIRQIQADAVRCKCTSDT